MLSVSTAIPWVIALLIGKSIAAVSFNQPKFCANATWNPNAITFANVSAGPFGLFVDIHNNVYATAQNAHLAYVWAGNGTTPINTLSGNLNNPGALFVATNGEIYVDSGATGKIVKWAANGSGPSVVANVSAQCLGLFIDLNDTLYCSLDTLNEVVKLSLRDNSSVWSSVAGNGTAASDANTVSHPNGLFVDAQFTLYVADAYNSRIQRFLSGERNGTTVAGNGQSGSYFLALPTDVFVDGNGYLFIVEANAHHVIASGPYGFRCVVGCSGSGGSASVQLSSPRTIGFDTFGNIYVSDYANLRIQKFILMANSCESQTTTQVMETTTVLDRTSTNLISTTDASTEPTSTELRTLIPSSTVAHSTDESTTRMNNQSCLSPSITLIPSTSTLSSPFYFRRNEDFYISSSIQLNCNQSLSVITQWTIINCSIACSSLVQGRQAISTTRGELYVPAKSLPVGIYQMQLTVTTISASNLSAASSAYVAITPTGVTANLVQLGTSMISYGDKYDLILDPGTFSVDPDADPFNATDWHYAYFCRISTSRYFPNINGSLLTMDDPRSSSVNSSCFYNASGHVFLSPSASSVRILAGSLPVNQTYQFMVKMMHRQSPSRQATAYLLVRVIDRNPQMIAVGCTIGTMCAPNLEFQLVNPTTQVALFSLCVGNCTAIRNVTWNIYYGSINSTTNTTSWTRFQKMKTYEDVWLFGTNTSNFTATQELFLANPQTMYWRFEVVYSFDSDASSSALSFLINQSPRNGSCAITPSNGTTSTVFTVSCSNWFDEDGIKDYALYSYSNDMNTSSLVAFSAVPLFEVRLPAGSGNTSGLDLFIYIQDNLDCRTVLNVTSILVVYDSTAMHDFVDSLKNSSGSVASHPLQQLLSNGYQNTVSQVISLLSREMNRINLEQTRIAAASGAPMTTIAVSPLGGSNMFIQIFGPLNTSALAAYYQQVNTYASVREYLMIYLANLPITTSNSIILQASAVCQLTQSTNQLTRLALSNAAEKCYQLARHLQSMAAKISYEDVQTAAGSIAECVSNVITATNGPLQERTRPLDLDFSRANDFPQDYDTDVESEWSNPNLFANGNDFSWETIQKGRNLYYQQQNAHQAIAQSTRTISLLTVALSYHLNVGQNFTLKSSSLFMLLKTISVGSLANQLIQAAELMQVHLPPIDIEQGLSSVSTRLLIQPLATGDRSQRQATTNLSRSLSFSILDRQGNDLPVQTNQSIELIIARDPNAIVPSVNLQNVTWMYSTAHHLPYNWHYVALPQPNVNPTASFHVDIEPVNSTLAYLFTYKFDSSTNEIEGWTPLCPHNLTNVSFYTYFIDNQRTVGHQSVIFGLRELNASEVLDFCSTQSSTSPSLPNTPFQFSSNYKLRTYLSGCYYLDPQHHWQSDGLLVGSRTNHEQTHCHSTHLTTFAGGFLVLPAPINWNYVFANVDFLRNKTIYITVICVCVIYIALMIYARHHDKKDTDKLQVMSLPDNLPEEKYRYQVIVFTGHRKDAGTDSHVQFIVAGDAAETGIRTFSHPSRKVLQRGDINSFLMTTSKSLGPLNYVRIWHDNTGKGAAASWFLKYILIRDLQTMETFDFICQQWLAVEKDDGRIERILVIASEEQKRQFSYLLSKQAYHSIAEGHLWFSVFSRPPSNTFTRVQRCTCCFVLLFVSMLLNILYYDQVEQAKTNKNAEDVSLSVGPLYIGSEQVGVGVVVELLSFLPSLLVVQFFRRIRSSHDARRSWMFPRWCLYLAYGLSLMIMIISTFLIIARGIEFGDLKAQKWLTSLVIGFFSSVFLVQPIKIVSLVIFFACFIKKFAHDKEVGEYLDGYHPQGDAQAEPVLVHRPRAAVHRLDNTELVNARRYRLKQIQMWTMIRETLTYVYFLAILHIVTYSNIHQHAFLQVNHLRSFLSSEDYVEIRTADQYWDWLEHSFVEDIRAGEWYNGQAPRNLSGFLNDKSNRLIGWATIRQLRVHSDACRSQRLVARCAKDYTLFNEEKRSFPPGWNNDSSQQYSSSIERAFRYQTGDQLQTYTFIGEHTAYSAGGYVYEFRGRLSYLRSNLSELHQLGWIDRQTRALIIQLSVYNPNVELFTSITLLLEVLSTGGFHPSTRFEPISFQLFTSLPQLICIILYMLLVVYLMSEQVRNMIRMKVSYFRQFWSFIDLGIIGCSWAGAGIYVWRYRESQRISQLFRETNGYVSVNLQLAVHINDVLIVLLGFCCFFGTLKLLRLCRYNRRLAFFIETIRHARKDLMSFASMFCIVYVAFLVLFYLLFVSKLWSCSSLLRTAQMLLEMILMKFDAYELTEAAAFLGPFSFSLFIFFVVFVCMSMFVTIISDSFRTVRDNAKRGSNDEDNIGWFFLRQLQQCTGLGGKDPSDIRHERHYSTYQHPVDQFPAKVDQLLDALNRLHMTHRS